MIKKLTFRMWLTIFSVVMITLLLARPYIEKAFNRVSVFDTTEYAIDFIDDGGYRIQMERPADAIISLYSAHTENLFELGLDREIIGVGKSDIYPATALTKEVFDYRSDPEKIIARRPDVVIIRPFIERHSPDFVASLRRAGIVVVSLYPDTYEDFDTYIMNLAKVTGKEKTAKEKLANFHKELEAIKQETEVIKDKVGVYFESSDREYKTVTKAAIPAHMIEIAGGINVASDAVAIEQGSSIAAYGIERILMKSKEIDVYVTQRGAMGGGGNIHSISIRPGFHAIKAIENGCIVEINQKIISSPTFRLVKGARELARAFYPDIFDTIKWEKEEETITREELAEVLIRYTHKPLFVPTSSYYKDEEREHYYGLFQDVTTQHPRFDMVETAMQKGFFEGYVDEEGLEYFRPEEGVTREAFAKLLFLISDIQRSEKEIEIADLDLVEEPSIVITVVENNLMEVMNGEFLPRQAVTKEEVKRALNRLDDLK